MWFFNNKTLGVINYVKKACVSAYSQRGVAVWACWRCKKKKFSDFEKKCIRLHVLVVVINTRSMKIKSKITLEKSGFQNRK